MPSNTTASGWSERAYRILLPTLPTCLSFAAWRMRLGSTRVQQLARLLTRLKDVPSDAASQRWVVTLVCEACARPSAGTRRDTAADQVLALGFIAAGGPPSSRSGARRTRSTGDALADYLEELEQQSDNLSGTGGSGEQTRKEYVTAYAPLVDALLRPIDRQLHLR